MLFGFGAQIFIGNLNGLVQSVQRIEGRRRIVIVVAVESAGTKLSALNFIAR
jgi:hypothetical protein